jgi:hypothetical protein
MRPIAKVEIGLGPKDSRIIAFLNDDGSWASSEKHWERFLNRSYSTELYPPTPVGGFSPQVNAVVRNLKARAHRLGPREEHQGRVY